MLEKSRNAVFSPWSVVSGQSKSRPVKAAGAEVGAQRRNQKLHVAVAKSTFGSENVQKHEVVRSTFVSWDVEKCTPLWRDKHVEVKMLKKLVAREHFWSSDVEKCAPLWWNVHLEVKMLLFAWKCTKHVGFGALFEVLMSKHCTPAVARSTFASEKCTEYLCFSTLFELQMSKNLSLSKFFSQSISQVVN